MSKLIGFDKMPINGAKRKLNIVYSVPSLPDDPAGLDETARHIESLGVTTPADAFAVAICRSLAKALRRIEELEARDG